MKFSECLLFLILINVLVISFKLNNSSELDQKVIDYKIESDANSQTVIFREFCEENNIFTSSKYACYKQAFTEYGLAKDKSTVLDTYKAKYKELLKNDSKSIDWSSIFNSIWIEIFLIILIPIVLFKLFFRK